MSEIDIEALFHRVGARQRADAVRSLLVGNDTGCFTLDQYRRAYERISGYDSSVWPISDDLATRHLRATGLVREVRPGVWAAIWPSDAGAVSA